MNNKLKYVIAFSAGAAAGSVITWKLLKTKYEQISREEIESVKETWAKKYNDSTVDTCDEEIEDDEEVEIQKYEGIANTYNSYYEESEEGGGPTSMKKDRPYIISPDEYGEFEDYMQIGLTYYSDGVLADEDDSVIEGVNDIVGIESLRHFGDYEDDLVFVRNDAKKADYEIAYDPRKYDDVTRWNRMGYDE